MLIKSSKTSILDSYFLAIWTTSLKLCSINCSLAYLSLLLIKRLTKLSSSSFVKGSGSIILEFPECEPYYMIEVDRVNNTDTFDIQVEVHPEYYTDRITELSALKKRITARVQSVVGISPNIKIVEPNTIERSMGKAKHAIDHRKFE